MSEDKTDRSGKVVRGGQTPLARVPRVDQVEYRGRTPIPSVPPPLPEVDPAVGGAPAGDSAPTVPPAPINPAPQDASSNEK